MTRGLEQEVDVLVVGLGPVGACVAALLGRHGVRTLAIDREADVLEHPRAIALDHDALRALQRAGLSPDAFPTLPIPFVAMRSPFVGEFARIDMSGTTDEHPKLVTFYQPDLERALRAKVAELPTVQVELSTRHLALQERGNRVTATITDSDGKARRIAARYIVAADGANSSIRRAVGLDFVGQTYAEDWLIVDVRGAPPIEHVEFTCDPERPSPRMSAPGDRQRFEFMLRPGEVADSMLEPDTIRRLLSPWVAADDVHIERKAVYRFHARVASRFSRGRVFLVGDAAHLTPPFAGQGLVAGLRDALNLSWKLAWVVSGRAHPSVLASYDMERRPQAAAVIRLAVNMGHLINPGSVARARLSHQAVKWLRKSRIGRALVDEQRGKPQNRFGSGLFCIGASRGPFARGGQLPQARLCAGTAPLPSDDLLGPGFVLVLFGASADAVLDGATARAFEAAGGRVVHIEREGSPTANIADYLAPAGAWPRLSAPWAFVLRPDLVIAHDGPASQAPRLVREVLALLDGRAPLRVRPFDRWRAALHATRRTPATIQGSPDA